MATYDSGQIQARRMLPLANASGYTIPGTAASDTVIIKIRILDSITIDSAGYVAMTGGTAAGPTVALQKSLAGTGAGVTFASKAFGTAADATTAAMTVTSTTFVAGDCLLVTNVAGTSASTPKLNLTIGYKETFPTP